MKHIEDCIIKSNKKVAEDIYKMELESEKIIKESYAGQFLEIKVSNQLEPLLRRPISINEIKLEENLIVIYYKVLGKGTDLMSQAKQGDTLSVIGPLGNGFDTNYKGLNIGIVGGGIGTAPLLELAKVLNKDNNVNTYFGFNDFSYLVEDMKKNSDKVEVSTISGREGYKGFITDILENEISRTKFDLLYACGPAPMLKKVFKIARDHNIRCQISLEERMGCGFGACVGCSIETTDGNMKKVCTDGPVFWNSEVDLND